MSPKAKYKKKLTKKYTKEVYEAQYELGLQFNELFFEAIKTLDKEFKIEYRVNKLGQIELLVMF